MPQPTLDVFQPIFAVFENIRVRFELDERPVRLFRLAGVFFLQFADFKTRPGKFPVTMAAHKKVFRQRIDRLRADAVEADAELENVVVVLCAGVDFGDAVVPRA